MAEYFPIDISQFGPYKSIQFNDNGILNGSSNFSFNKITNQVSLTGSLDIAGYIRFDPVSTNIDQSVSASYIYVSGSTNDLYFTQNGNGYTNTTRLRWLEGNLYTGLLHGGIISAATGSTTFNISSGSGIIVTLNATLNDDPYPTVQFVNWDNFTNQSITYLTSSIQTFLGIDSNGQIIQQVIPWNDGQYNTSISLGTILHQNQATVNASINYPNVAYGYKQRTYDFIKAFGPLKLSGFTLSTSSSLGLTVGSGTAFADGRNYQVDPNNPSYITDAGTTVSKIFRYYQSGSSFVQDTNNALGYTGVDTTQYNPGGNGVLTAVSPSKFYVHRIFWYPNSATKGIVDYYGLDEYSTLDEAQVDYTNEPFIETPNTQQNAIFLGIVIVKGNSNFLSANDYRLIQASLFRAAGTGGGGGGGGTTSPGGLTTQIQYNDGGLFNGVPVLTYNGTTLSATGSFSGSFTGSFSGSLTGSLFGTASWATNTLTASYVNPLIQDVIITGSTFISSSNATQLQVGSNLLFVSGSGRVGIGTTTPSHILQVVGATRLGNLLFGSAGNNAINNTNNDTSINLNGGVGIAGGSIITPSARLQVRGSGATSATIALQVENTNASSSLVVLDNGNVGVGITNPSFKFQVVSGSSFFKPLNNSDDGISISNQGFLTFRDTADAITTRLRGIAGSYQFQDASYNIKSLISTNNNITYFNKDGGNVGIGITSPAAVLHISGASNSGLLKIDSPTTNNILYVSGSGTVGIGNTGVVNTALAITANGAGGGNFIIQGYDSSAINRFLVTATGRLQMTGTTDTGTSGTDERVRLTYTFNPTSGTREHMGIYLVQAVSQSGGANGITRGLYIQPTLTSAADYRAIENTAGNNLFNLTSGNTYVGLSANNGTARFQVRGSGATSATTALRVENTNASASIITTDDNVTYLYQYGTAANNAIFYNGSNGSGNLSLIRNNTPGNNEGFSISFGRSDGTIAAPSNVQINRGLGLISFSGYHTGDYRQGATIRAIVDLGDVSSISMPTRLVFSTSPSGSTTPVERMRITSTGSVLIGTTTDSGFRLDVSGSARITNGLTVTGSLIATSFTGSLQGTASWAVSASQAITASYVLNAVSSSFATSASYATQALSASWAPGGGSAFPYVGTAVITGSLIVSGSTNGIDTSLGQLLTDNGSGIQAKVDWQNGVLNSSVGNYTVDWENKTLNDSGANISIDWENRTLSEGTGTYVALEYSSDTYVNSQLYYRNIIPGQVQRAVADTPASKYGGQVIQATVDGAVTDFQLVYLDIDGIWYALKNLTVVSTKMVGICVDVAGGYVLVEGDIGVSDDSSQGAVVTGADHGLPVYISSTTGEMTTTTPASGVIRILGHIYYQSTTDANWWTMKFRPSNDWYEI